MAYDTALEARITPLVQGWSGLSSKKMFGGICWLLGGNICIGIWKQNLIVRCGLEGWQEALALPHVLPFDVTGRSMRGWLMVEPEGFNREQDLRNWLETGRHFVATLPVKE